MWILFNYNYTIIFKDFSYDENYFELWVMRDAGGPGLEFHQFDHIDMPLDEVCDL